ncbi:MAG: hypothetical protein LBL97_09285 [Prevotellaceae bacterium]|jgi:3-oxoacyl-[acyl-carrier-protein] synthase-1|nr:hypothetical protein [Prevotellaceae bacterium]
MQITDWIRITPAVTLRNGVPVDCDTSEAPMPTALYRRYINDYPKFFKMDALGKLGFVASELLLAAEPKQPEREDRAIVLFNRSGSLCNDRHYQATIQEPATYFPSPALFVYTLPNIVTGEIAIRHKYYGETSFYVLDTFRADIMETVIAATLQEPLTTSVLGGWLECSDEAHFDALLFLAKAGDDPSGNHIETIYNQ